MAAKRVGFGAAMALKGKEMRVLSTLEYFEHNLAIEVVGQNWSSEVIFLFLEDWEVARMALSCHLLMDFLCPEMRDACWESSESLVSPRSLCSECQRSSLVDLSQQ